MSPMPRFYRILRLIATLALVGSVCLAAEPIRVTGRVVANGPQRSLAGAWVELFRVDGTDKTPLASGRTGDDGSFELAAPEAGGFRVTAQKEGYLPMELPFLPLVEDTELPLAVLVPGKALEARTVGADGRPLAAVEAELSLAIRWRPPGMEEPPSEWRLTRQRGVSDKDGRLTFMGVLEGAAGLTATSPPYRGQTASRADPFAPLVLRLSPSQARDAQALVPPKPTRRLAGRAVDLVSGGPVAGALVWSGWPLLAPVTRTDAEGAFQLVLPAGQVLWLAAAAAGYLPGERLPVPSRVSDPLILKLAPAATLSGVVVDGAGQPVPGVRVVADPPIVRASNRGSGPRWVTARSRADGGFRLTGLRPGGTYELTATRNGFARTQVTARTAPAGRPSAPIRIVLSGGKTAFGRVVDEAGQPIAGVEVTLVNPVGIEDVTAASDRDGKFELHHLEAGTRDLLFRAEGYGRLHHIDVEIPLTAPSVDLGAFTLPSGAWIEGRVTDTRGAPIQGAVVGIITSEPDAELWRLATGQVFEEQRTGPAGRFRANGLQRGGRYQVVVSHPGYVQASLPDVAAPTPEPVRVEMKVAHALAGRVLGPEGEPVSGAALSSVHEIRTASGGFSSRESLGQTDAEGRFRVTGLPPGLLDLEVWAENYGSRKVTGLQIPDEGDLEGVEIAFQRGAFFEVVVLTSEGASMAGVSVDLVPERRDSRLSEVSFERGSCQTDPQGRCRLSVREPGTYRVTAVQDSRSASVVAATSPEGTPIVLRLPPGFDVSGWVRAIDGGGALGATIRLEAEHWSSSLQADADGTFIFSGLPEGTYRLSARDRVGRASSLLEIKIAGRAVRDLELKLDRDSGKASISGRVLGLTAVGVHQVWVAAFPADPQAGSRSDTSGRVGADGRYRIEGLEPGDWNVEARTPHGRTVEGTVRIEPGTTAASLDLQFPPGILTLSGRVQVDGAPLAGAEIGVSTASGSSLGGSRTGWDGSFALRDLEPGAVTVQFFGLDGIVASRTVQLNEDREILIDLTTGRLRGTVLSAAGEPVEDAAVTVEGLLSKGDTLGEDFFSAASRRSGPDGSFEAPRLVSGTYRVLVQKDGFAPIRATVEVPPAGEGTVEIRLTPQGGS